MENSSENFLFQSINGSGKTGAFLIPSLMKIKESVRKPQVIVFANTRELIRQTQQIATIISKYTKIQAVLGETSSKLNE
jgi:ATP-dependent RNA helicase DDX6/DHH1